jgi:uncharacterized repeat protein (TIGR03803 family)
LPSLAAPPVTEELLHRFEYLGGYAPKSALIQASDGNYYGTTSNGSAKHGGTVYRLTPDGVHTVIHEFDLYDYADGRLPDAGLMQASNGWLYGTTSSGGAFDRGVVFRLSLAGDYEALDSFSDDKGIARDTGGTLIETPVGQIVGVAPYGGRFGYGTLYALNADGLITTLHSFSLAEAGYPGSLSGGLIMGRYGYLYGVSSRGGDYGWGSIYRVDPHQATVTTDYSFSGLYAGYDATIPLGPLANGPDGELYGVSSGGGTNNSGTVFRTLPSGKVAVLHSFKKFGNAGGNSPVTPILVDDQGNVFGVTFFGGTSATCNQCGVVYRLSHGGSYQLLHSFAGPPDDGQSPPAGLLHALDGSLVGVTGYPYDDPGTVYRLSRTPPKAR